MENHTEVEVSSLKLIYQNTQVLAIMTWIGVKTCVTTVHNKRVVKICLKIQNIIINEILDKRDFIIFSLLMRCTVDDVQVTGNACHGLSY
jgi:hypothetical protein